MKKSCPEYGGELKRSLIIEDDVFIATYKCKARKRIFKDKDLNDKAKETR